MHESDRFIAKLSFGSWLASTRHARQCLIGDRRLQLSKPTSSKNSERCSILHPGPDRDSHLPSTDQTVRRAGSGWMKSLINYPR